MIATSHRSGGSSRERGQDGQSSSTTLFCLQNDDLRFDSVGDNLDSMRLEVIRVRLGIEASSKYDILERRLQNRGLQKLASLKVVSEKKRKPLDNPLIS